MPYTPGSEEGLPQAARQRLQGMRGTEQKHGLFTSDIEYFAVGTAVASIPTGRQVSAPSFTLPLTG